MLRTETLIFILIVGLSLSGCATIKKPRPWTKGEKVGVGFFLAGHAVDTYTTIRAQDYPDRIYERNPILDKHPDDHEIYLYMGATAAIGLIAAHYFQKLRLPICIGYGGLGFYMAWGNYKKIREVRE